MPLPLPPAGLPKLLLQEVEDTSDALSCMAALALLQQLAEQQAAGMGTLLADLAMGRVTHLAADPLLRASALATGAALLAAALRDGAAAMDVDGQRNGHPLLQVIAGGWHCCLAPLWRCCHINIHMQGMLNDMCG